MASDYEAIREENIEGYGNKVSRYGKLLVQDTYVDRTHFIFELLQNAEDALKRRSDSWTCSRTVSFDLLPSRLRVSHFGAPFNEDDIHGICGIAESTKEADLTEIGRFGIGFKSVYAFTDEPEIHSGDEDFAIESYVLPKAIPGIYPMEYDETVFILPFKAGDESAAYSDINAGLKSLDAATLLFLSQIEEIAWINADGESGRIARTTEPLDDNVRKITISTQAGPETPSRHEWLVFSRLTGTQDGTPVGNVDIAFALDNESGRIQPTTNAKLYTYFTTELETHVGFLMNGPYRTTLNRENVAHHDTWNRGLVSQTADLLVHSLMWLRDNDRLDLGTLRCLPLEKLYFMDYMLAPLFDKTQEALSTEPLLPKFGGGYISGIRALLARTAALRDLFSPSQIRSQAEGWLDDSINRDHALQSYVTSHLNVPEIRPESVIPNLSRGFLQAQPNEWIIKLYEFLFLQRAMLGRIKAMPIVRLEGGKHVKPMENGEVQAYLPTDHHTSFPTVARVVYNNVLSRLFLESLGLTYPDLVDDVIANILPKYCYRDTDVTDEEYGSDMARILNAYRGATSTQGNRLITEIKTARFVRSIDAHDIDDLRWDVPSAVYGSDDMTKLFHGVGGVRLTDSHLDPSTTSAIRELMNVCGFSDSLRPVEFDNEARFTRNQRREMRNSETFTRELGVIDKQLLGLRPLLAALSELEPEVRIDRSKLLWDGLSRLSNFDFLGWYRWFYYSDRSCRFDAEFVETLNSAAWIPDSDGNLKRPSEVDFDSLGWIPNDFLQSKIRFRPPFNRARAMEAGVEEFQLEMLDLLNEQGITDMADLRKRLRIRERTAAGASDSPQNVQTPPRPPRQDPRPPQPAPPAGTFAEALAATMTVAPSRRRTNTFAPPPGGPKTGESARADVGATVRDGGSGAYESRIATEWQPTDAAEEMAQRFRYMALGDYGSRCQVCSRSFSQRNGESQVFVVHVVPPSDDSRANNFGDLLGLCGWHYALIRYGQWALLDDNGSPLDDADELRRSVERASQDIDDNGNDYVPVPIRFWNVYEDWNPEPQTIDATIRYSIPHWTYLKELLKV